MHRDRTFIICSILAGLLMILELAELSSVNLVQVGPNGWAFTGSRSIDSELCEQDCIWVTSIQRLQSKISAMPSMVECCKALGICRINISLYVFITSNCNSSHFFIYSLLLLSMLLPLFFQVALYRGLNLNNHRLKINWGQNLTLSQNHALYFTYIEIM